MPAAPASTAEALPVPVPGRPVPAVALPPRAVAPEVASPASPAAAGPAVPEYLRKAYWWAYVHPRAVRVFERDWLVDAILFGNYRRLCGAALAELGASLRGRTLQVACVYGELTPRLRARLAPDARLDVVDVLPIQLANLAAKLPPDPRLRLVRGDAAALPFEDASYDQVLMFFLLHELPEAVRRAALAQALRVLKPGGRLVIVDYHRPGRMHPARPLLRAVFAALEPYAMDLWRHGIDAWLPPGFEPAARTSSLYFGGLYQKLVLTR